MRMTPVATTLEEILAVCERQVSNCAAMFYDCADNEDCDDSYLQQLSWTKNNWMELAADVKAMIENEAKKHLPSAEGSAPTQETMA